MLIELGVTIEHLKRPMRRFLWFMEDLYPDCIISSTREGDHNPGSLHYADLAVDFWPITVHNNKIDEQILRDAVERRFGKNRYDIVFKHNHIHVEYDPKEDKS